MIQRPFRYYYLKVTRQRGTPENIALGMAIGVFCGLFIPFPQMVLAALAATLTKANRITAILGTWVSNPFTFPLIITFYLLAGQQLTGLRLTDVRPPDTPAIVEQGQPKKDGENAKEGALGREGDATKKPKIPVSAGELFIFIFSQGGKLLIVWFVASTLCASVGAFISYHITRVLVEGFRRRRRRRQQKRKTILARKAAEEEALRGIHMGLDDQ